MALIVEDGTGLPNADSYVSLADADAYLALYGHAEWSAATDADAQVRKEVALRRATRFVDNLCQSGWIGRRFTSTQALDWPREGIVDELGHNWPVTKLPDALRHAVCELASRYFAGNAPDADLPRGGQVKRQKTDVLETEYFGNASSTTLLPVVVQLLSGLTLTSLTGFGSVPIVRCL